MKHALPHCAGEVLERALKEEPTREALVATDRRFTYEQLDEEIERTAAAIGALGIGAGDVVAISLPNASDVVVTFHAIMRLGAVWLGVNRNLAPPEKRYVLDDAGAQLMLADADVARATGKVAFASGPTGRRGLGGRGTRMAGAPLGTAGLLPADSARPDGPGRHRIYQRHHGAAEGRTPFAPQRPASRRRPPVGPRVRTRAPQGRLRLADDPQHAGDEHAARRADAAGRR